MMTRVRVLRDSGIEQFRSYLQELREGSPGGPPFSLLMNPDDSGELPIEALVDTSAGFKDRLTLGRYLASQLAPLHADPLTDENIGLWSWLALAFFDVICPERTGATRRVGATHRYILSNEFRVYYRHLVRTPYLLYRLHGDRAAALLAGSPDTHGEASEQILGRQHLLTNHGLFEALDSLYVVRQDVAGATSCGLQRGASTKSGGGTMRRLGKIVNQFELTFDLQGMTGDQILELLPSEFNRFKRATIG